MCGIAGIIASSNNQTNAVVGMIEAMRHRGPDDQGFFYHNQVGLGQSRLSIIDLVGGKQPMYSADRNLVLVFNGEMYNYKELTHELKESGVVFQTDSDSEVLIHLFEKYREGMLEKLNGMFAFAIYNQTTGEVFIARDRLGVKPLYIYNHQGTFAFASEIEALRTVPTIRQSLTINGEAVWHYFSLLYIPPPITIYQEIAVLPAGHYVFFKNNTLSAASYWRPAISHTRANTAETQAELENYIASSVALRTQSDVPYGAYLSGGVDSSLIVTQMAKVSASPVKTFTAQIQSAELDELAFAKQVSEKCGTEHTVLPIGGLNFSILQLIIKHIGQPFADSSLLPTYLISKEVRKYVTVILGGDGGDELFAGYDKYNAVKNTADATAVEQAFINRVPAGIKEKALSTAFKDTWGKTTTFDHLVSHENNHNYQGFDLLRFLDIQFFLQGDILPKLDSMSMAASVEAREPLLDYRIVELALSLSPEALVEAGRNKVVLKQLLEKSYPADFVNRQKVGFIIPIADWLEEHSDLLPAPLPEQFAGYFDEKAIASMVADFKAGDMTLGNFLFAYLMFSYWAQSITSYED